jgi:hypothetical protein
MEFEGVVTVEEASNSGNDSVTILDNSDVDVLTDMNGSVTILNEHSL